MSSDGANYLEFLRKLKKVFPPGKVISIAAPASFWHLRAFPLAEMWQYVDYIIYMTYDFHGRTIDLEINDQHTNTSRPMGLQ